MLVSKLAVPKPDDTDEITLEPPSILDSTFETVDIL